MGRVSPQALNEWVKIFLPPLCLTKDWVPTCGEKKVYHPTRPPPGGLRFLSETASLQEAGRALAIGPHPSILLPKQWRLFLFVLRITLVETNSFRLMKILPQSSHSFPVDPSYPFSLNEPSSPIREWGIEILQSTSHFWCPVWRFCCVFRKEKGEGQGSLVRKAITINSNSEWIKSPQVGFEPTTSQLTADRSTTELLRKNGLKEADSRSLDQPTEKKKSSSLFLFHIHREKGWR